VAPPPGRSEPDWAAKIHVAVAPVYYHNYLLGEMLASQLEETCERECGGLVGSAEAGELLVSRVFQHGSSWRWDEVTKEATGGSLSAEAFARRANA
jgi:peptidyl-dipeptidase A